MAIKVKLMAQLSGGDINTVIEAASALLEVDVSEVMLDEVYPAKIELFVDQKLLSPERIEMLDLIAEAIKRILAAGVGLRLYLRTHSTYRHEIVVRHCGYAATEQSAPPFTKDRDARMTLKTLYGAFQPTEVSAAHPRRIGRIRLRRRAQGALYTTPESNPNELTRRNKNVEI